MYIYIYIIQIIYTTIIIKNAYYHKILIIRHFFCINLEFFFCTQKYVFEKMVHSRPVTPIMSSRRHLF